MFKARSKPRRVGREADREEDQEPQDTGPVVRRPGASTAVKKSSKLKLSFGPDQAAGEEPEETEVSSDLRKTATEKSSFKRSLNGPVGLGGLALRSARDEDRPSYSKDYLSELRKSTPTTPQALSTDVSDSEASFGEVIPSSNTAGQLVKPLESTGVSLVPTDAEIREKKERRARLAKEQDYISLNDRDDDNEISLLPRKSAPEKRMVRDDEDFAEGFDEYVEDGGIAIGRKAKAAQLKKTRAEIEELINEAEQTSEEDDSEAERNQAYTAAQTRAGMDGLARKDDSKPRAPTVITPIPRLGAVIERLRGQLREKETNKTLLTKRMEALQKEKAEIGVREIEIQTLITDTGKKYEQLRIEAGLDAEVADSTANGSQMGRGLEDIGS